MNFFCILLFTFGMSSTSTLAYNIIPLATRRFMLQKTVTIASCCNTMLFTQHSSVFGPSILVAELHGKTDDHNNNEEESTATAAMMRSRTRTAPSSTANDNDECSDLKKGGFQCGFGSRQRKKYPSSLRRMEREKIAQQNMMKRDDFIKGRMSEEITLFEQGRQCC
mmetsp:Transcript_20125/g.25417  ORF Transcript_20125/g.25417 Transcript_20125/m.25417 type:complete len:166 (-) Transcript_20125:33-530(-)